MFSYMEIDSLIWGTRSQWRGPGSSPIGRPSRGVVDNFLHHLFGFRNVPCTIFTPLVRGYLHLGVGTWSRTPWGQLMENPVCACAWFFIFQDSFKLNISLIRIYRVNSSPPTKDNQIWPSPFLSNAKLSTCGTFMRPSRWCDTPSRCNDPDLCQKSQLEDQYSLSEVNSCSWYRPQLLNTLDFLTSNISQHHLLPSR